jgi:CubicO group peptidase (beta-lactamase class C family)
LLSGLLAGCTAPPSGENSLDAVLAGLPADQPGCAAALYDDDAIAWTGARGLADVEAEVPIGEGTVFDIGSTSKQFTATAVLLLVQRGELSLDDTLDGFVPELPQWAAAVTIRHLLHHTSGIPDYLHLVGRDLDERVTVEQTVDALADVGTLQFDPGEHFRYSNSGYFLLSLVVEAVDGRTLADFLADEVFATARIDAVVDPVPDMADHAKSYEPFYGRPVEAVALWEQTGDGAVQITAAELAEWGAQYWQPTVGGDQLLAARTADAVEAEDGFSYGAGIFIGEDAGQTVLGHGGRWAGFVAELLILPDARLAAAVTCNLAERDATAMAEALLRAHLEEEQGS